jgi:anti-sigma factor RsiW
VSEHEHTHHHLGHRLSGYLDGELPRGTRQLVSAHLALCSTCRVAAVKDSHTKAGLRELSAPAPSDALLNSLLSMPRIDGPSPLVPGEDKGFPMHPAQRRRLPGAHLLAAGVAGVAALTVGSAVVVGGPVHSHAVRHASIGGSLSGSPTVVDAGDTAPGGAADVDAWVPEPVTLPALPHIEGAEFVRAR